jgi:Fanconi anemia group M protein
LSEVKIVVDSREAAAARNIVAELRGRGLEVEVGRLEAGDYLIQGAEAFLVERATLPDFARKIVDARLWSQLEAMARAENVRPLLVIERGRLRSAVSPESIYGAMASAAIGWGVPIICTEGWRHTAILLERLWARAKLGGAKGARPLFKPKAESPDEEVLRVVASLPGVGPTGAEALLRRFRTIQALANASVEEIMEVEGFGEKRAMKVYQTFRHEWGRGA